MSTLQAFYQLLRDTVADMLGISPPVRAHPTRMDERLQENDYDRSLQFIPVFPGPGEPPLTCPVTRQQLLPGGKHYRCRQCGIMLSPEGWHFLQQNDGGRCCGCGTQKSIFPCRIPKEPETP